MSSQLTHHRTNSLAAWFLLLTVAAVLCAFLPPMLGPPKVMAITGAVLFSTIFALLGLIFRPRLRNAAVGFVAGLIMGPVIGLLLSATTAELSVSIFAVLAGSVMIVVVGLVGRSTR